VSAKGWILAAIAAGGIILGTYVVWRLRGGEAGVERRARLKAERERVALNAAAQISGSAATAAVKAAPLFLL